MMKYIKYFLLAIALLASSLACALPHDELRLGHKMDDIFLGYFLCWLGLASYITAWFAWTLFLTRVVLEKYEKKTTLARVLAQYALVVLVVGLVIWQFWQQMLQR